MTLARITLPVVCTHFRYTPKQYGCAKHGECAHTEDWTACEDFAAVQRAGVTPKPVAASEYQECGGCTGKATAKKPVTAQANISPNRVVKIRLPEGPNHGHYNCGLLEWRGELLLASRLGWSGSRTWLHELGGMYEDYQPRWSRDLNLRDPKANLGVEDPRLFVFRDRVHVAVSGYELGETKRTSQLVFAMNDELTAGQAVDVGYYNRAMWEKNWQFFEHDGELHCVYSIAPHLVLRFNANGVPAAYQTQAKIKIGGVQHYRGGAPPVRVGDEYYHWFHTVASVGGITVYGLGLYVFEARPPFAIKRFVPSVILQADTKIPDWNKSVVFPCGALLRGSEWLISYGQNDRECRLAWFSVADVERMLG